MSRTLLFFPTALALLVSAAGCSDDSKPGAAGAPTLAPTATALAPAKAATMEAKKLTIDRASSKVDFAMDAPQEKIVGHVPGAATGDLQVDFMDVTKTTGVITVDISGLEVFQAKADKDGKFGPETKVDAQNTHARTWLEISPDAPADTRAENAKVQFSIQSIEAAGEKNVSKLAGAERKVMLKVSGDFLLHGHKAPKVLDVEATFTMDGDKPVSVRVKTVKPFAVGLVEHDVKPRDAFGKFALKTLDALSPKVAKEAAVSLDVTAKPGS
jgi:polyisoprenoid-binding protein YceI